MSEVPNPRGKHVFWVSTIALHAVLIPVCLYWLIRYIKIAKTQQCCKPRHSIIIDILIIIQTNVILFWLIYKWMEYDMNLKFSQALHDGFYQFLAISFVIITTKYSQHLLNIYVNTQFVIFVNNKKWIQLISNIKSNVNWFIRNRDKYTKYTPKIINSLILAQIIIPGSLTLLQNHFHFMEYYEFVWNVSYIVFILLPVIITIYLFLKVKFLNDNYYIIKQFKYSAALILTFGGIMLILRVIGYLVPCKSILGIIISYMVMCLFPFLLLLNTFWVIKYVVPKVNNNDVYSLKKEKIYLSQILNNSFAMDILMKHLAKEFSIELLLSYIEMRQYEHYTMNKLDIISEDKILRTFPDIPISSIIAKYDNNDKMDDIALELFYKYIDNGCEYEININHCSRLKLSKYMDDQNKWFNDNINSNELCQLFHDSCKQVHKLLGFSLQRMHENSSIMIEIQKCFDHEQIF